MFKFCWFILGNGRKGYLERTIASWESNLIGDVEHKIIFDDSGDAKYVKWLNKTFGDRFTIVPVAAKSVGQVAALGFIFQYIKQLDVDYVLQLEEDWMLNRPLDISRIATVLQENPNILQMRIPRVVWYAPYHVADLHYGSSLLQYFNHPRTKTFIRKNDKDSWYEWRGDFYFWSHNPSIFGKKILDETYESITEPNHEQSFGMFLLKKYPEGASGFWAKNPYDAYINHIGIKDDAVLRGLPEHPSKGSLLKSLVPLGVLQFPPRFRRK
jgi:hypothetical protein